MNMKDEKGNWLDVDRSAVKVIHARLEPWQRYRGKCERHVERIAARWHKENPE
jgi:hypothetical protein